MKEMIPASLTDLRIAAADRRSNSSAASTGSPPALASLVNRSDQSGQSIGRDAVGADVVGDDPDSHVEEAGVGFVGHLDTPEVEGRPYDAEPT